MNMVGAKRINRYQEYIGLRRFSRGGLTGKTDANHQHQAEKNWSVGHCDSA